MARQRGQSVLELAMWVAVAGLVFAGGVFAVRWFQRGGEKPLTAEQQAYVRSVATQQAVAYIGAVATQQGESVRVASPSAVRVAQARGPAPVAPSAPPPAQNPRLVAPPTNTVVPPTVVPATPTPDANAGAAACVTKVQQEMDILNEFADEYRRGVPPGLSGLIKRLKEVTPGVITECASVMQAAGQQDAVHALCKMYDPDPNLAPYKPSACSTLTPPPGETWT